MSHTGEYVRVYCRVLGHDMAVTAYWIAERHTKWAGGTSVILTKVSHGFPHFSFPPGKCQDCTWVRP
jgi:hypothetical protein